MHKNEGYGFIQIFTEKIRISPTKLWRVCVMQNSYSDSRYVQYTAMTILVFCLFICTVKIENGDTVEPLLYDHPQNHIGVVV